MITMITVGTLALAFLVIGLAGLSHWAGGRVERERQRIETEQRLAEWRVRHLAREALRRLLDEARSAGGKRR